MILIILPIPMTSTRLPEKSTKWLCGKPMFEYVFDEAAKMRKHYDVDLCVTSESSTILQKVESLGCDKLRWRPKNLAEDPYQLVDVIRDVAEHFDFTKYETLILLQIDNPLTLLEDIQGCYKKHLTNNRHTVVTVVKEVSSENSFHGYTMEDGVLNAMFSQDDFDIIPDTYKRTGGIVVADMKQFIKKGTHLSSPMFGYELPRERAVDIDEQYDFSIADMLLNERKWKSYLHEK